MARRSEWKPTQGDIFSMLEERRALMPLDEMKIDQDYDSWSTEYQKEIGTKYLYGMPKGYRARFPSIMHDAVDRGLNNIMTGKRSVVRVTMPQGMHDDTSAGRKKLKKDKAYLESRLGALLYSIATFSTRDPVREAVRQDLALGLCCLSYGVARDRWVEPPFGRLPGKDGELGEPRPGRGADERAQVAEWKREREQTLAIDVQAVYPTRLFFDPYHEPPQDFIREEYIARGEASRQYPDLDLTSKEVLSRIPAGQAAGTCVRVQYFGKKWWGVWIDQVPVTPKEAKPDEEGIAKNKSGLLYHRMAYSGFGSDDGTGSLVYRIQGMIRNHRDEVIMLVVKYNILDAMLQTYGFSGNDFIANEDVDLFRKETEDYEIGPAVKNYYDGRHGKVVPQQLPQVPAALFADIGQLQKVIEIGLGPEIGSGVAQAGETASGQRSRFNISQAPYRATLQYTQQMLAAVLMDIVYLVEHEIREPIPVLQGGMTLDPRELARMHGFMLEVDFSPPSEEELSFKQDQIQKDLIAGLITREDAIRQGQDVSDAEEKLIEIDADRMMQALLADPQVMAMMTQDFLTSMGVAPPVPPAVPPDSTPGAGDVAPVGGPPGMATPPQPGQNGAQPQPQPVQQTTPTLGGPADMARQMQQYAGAPVAPLVGPGGM